MTEVEIEYCVTCDYLDKAMDVQAALLEEFGGEIETVTLRTGEGCILRTSVDGDVVHDKDEDGFAVDDVVDRVREQHTAAA